MKAPLAVTSLVFGLAACAHPRLVAPLRYEVTPTATAAAPEEAFRARPPAMATVAEATDSPSRETTMPNGLHVVLVERHEFPVVAATLVVDRGALELDDVGGLALAETFYFFARGGNELLADPWRAEARDYVWTSMESTAGAFDDALGRLAQTVRARLSPTEYEQRAAEWARVAKAGPLSMALIERKILFGEHHPYGYAGSGIEPITRARAQTIHDRLLQPTYTTLVIVGDVTPSQVDASAARWLGAWTATMDEPRRTTAPPAMNGPRLGILSRHDLVQERGSVFARGPLAASDDFEAFQVIAKLLGGSVSSKLYDRLRQESGEAYAIGASIRVQRTATWLSIEASYDADKAVRGIGDVLAAAERVRKGSLSDDEIAVARESVLAEWRGAMSTASGAASSYAARLAVGVGLDRTRDFPERLARVTRADLMRVAGTYLAPQALHVVFVGEDRWLDTWPLKIGGATMIRMTPP